MINLNESQIETDYKDKYISGVTKMENKPMILILDMDQVLDLELYKISAAV